MVVNINGKLLDCDSEKWVFEEKKGIRYYGTIKDENKKIVQFKIEENEFSFFKDLVGKDISINCDIFINGKYSLKVTGIN